MLFHKYNRLFLTRVAVLLCRSGYQTFFFFRACQQLLHLSRLLDITALEFVGEVLARESELVVLHDVGAAVGAVDAGSAAPATNL